MSLIYFKFRSHLVITLQTPPFTLIKKCDINFWAASRALPEQNLHLSNVVLSIPNLLKLMKMVFLLFMGSVLLTNQS